MALLVIDVAFRLRSVRRPDGADPQPPGSLADPLTWPIPLAPAPLTRKSLRPDQAHKQEVLYVRITDRGPV